MSNIDRQARKFRIVLLGLGTVGGEVLRCYKRAWNFELAAVMSRNVREISLPVNAQIFDSWGALRSALEAEKADAACKPGADGKADAAYKSGADSKSGADRRADATDSNKTKLGAIDAVVELLGGVDACLPIYEYFLRQGVPIVTANKALLAECGARLFPLARQHGTVIACEASCGGGIPIIDALLHGLRANCIYEFHGILNGTCNFILSKMAVEGCGYDEALGCAQREGLAEADPHLDVSGTDMAHKLAILAMLAFGCSCKLEDIPKQGIEALTLAHIQSGEKLGLSLKLVASAWRLEGGSVALRVGPCFVVRHSGLVPGVSVSALANVDGSYNGIVFYGDAVGRIYLEGRGAGAAPTASAVLADLCQLQNGSYASAFADFPHWPGLASGLEPESEPDLGPGAQIKSAQNNRCKNDWAKLPQHWLVFVSQNAAVWQRLAEQRGIETQIALKQEDTEIFLCFRVSATQLEEQIQAFCRTCGTAAMPIPIFEAPKESL